MPSITVCKCHLFFSGRLSSTTPVHCPEVAKDLGGAVRVVLGGVDHERRRWFSKSCKVSMM